MSWNNKEENGTEEIAKRGAAYVYCSSNQC